MQKALLVGLVIAAATALAPSALANDPYFKSGVALFQKKDYHEALRYFEASVKASPANPTNLYYSALCRHYLGDQKTSRELFKTLSTQFPASEEAKNATTYLAAMPAVSEAPVRSNVRTSTSESSLESLPDEVSIPFRKGHGGHLFVDGDLNGRAMPMIFDTGAESCVFGQNHLDAAGVMEKATTPDGYSMGVGGLVKNNKMDASIRIGNLKRRLPVNVQANLATAPLLGQTLLHGYAYDIDNSAGIIRMHKKGAHQSAGGFDAIEIPYQVEGREMVVMVEIEGKRIPMFFDTGAHGVAMSASHMSELGLRLPEDYLVGQSRGVAGTTSMIQFNVKSIKLGPIQKTNFPISVIGSQLPHPLLGQTFFGDRKYSIDQERRVIRFSR